MHFLLPLQCMNKSKTTPTNKVQNTLWQQYCTYEEKCSPIASVLEPSTPRGNVHVTITFSSETNITPPPPPPPHPLPKNREGQMSLADRGSMNPYRFSIPIYWTWTNTANCSLLPHSSSVYWTWWYDHCWEDCCKFWLCRPRPFAVHGEAARFGFESISLGL